MKKQFLTSMCVLSLGVGVCSSALAQNQPAEPPTAVFKVNAVAKSTKAINYRHRSGSTEIDFTGTAIMRNAKGHAKVESRQGAISIEANFRDVGAATQFGAEYLTYVLWAVSPEGRPKNLGEILLDGGKSHLDVTTDLQVFGLIVTAEPYFSVTQPSDLIVMENEVRQDTLGKFEIIDAQYELLQRGQYQKLANVLQLKPDPSVPVEIYEARNAVQIAQSSGADKYASDAFKKAQGTIQQAEKYLQQKQRKPAIMIARETVQTAEDARVIAVKRQQDEALDNERQAAAAREAEAKKRAENEQRQREQAEAERKAEEARRAQAEAAKATAEAARVTAEAEKAAAEQRRLVAELTAAKEAAERAKAEAAQAQAAAAAEKAQHEAAEAERLRQQAELEKQQLRAQLLQQLNAVLETKDTDRGLVVTMADVLFDSGQFTLRPAAREKLAKLSGIVLAHPGLKLAAEGHTDSTGGADFNQRLSVKRAEAVVSYLGGQGIGGDNLSASGFGDTRPIAGNNTSAGRQQNRRVELIVSGEVIGTSIGGATQVATQ
ncbi:MAG TPA: OmpA family protein [Bryobacteraceae bacterium]|jgi:outer membrane protein OmpA-like peptidoglycan-associated protein